jgi:hypothetical protein
MNDYGNMSWVNTFMTLLCKNVNLIPNKLVFEYSFIRFWYEQKKCDYNLPRTNSVIFKQSFSFYQSKYLIFLVGNVNTPSS